jgi:predicted ATP-grasp superfamily ATP-dependent carboligase
MAYDIDENKLEIMRQLIDSERDLKLEEGLRKMNNHYHNGYDIPSSNRYDVDSEIKINVLKEENIRLKEEHSILVEKTTSIIQNNNFLKQENNDLRLILKNCNTKQKNENIIIKSFLNYGMVLIV